MATAPGDVAAESAVDLWAMAAELERQFAGYKQRFPDRRSSCVAADDDHDTPEDVGVNAAHDAAALHAADNGGASSGEEDEEAGERAGARGVRGRKYEAYTRRRDERLRTVWRARMERKEAEVMALWAQLRGGGGPTAADDDDGCAAGEEAEEGGEKRRSSDVAAPGRVPGKKHPRTRRSFSSASLVNSSRPDVGLRRALSQEPPPPSEPPAGADGGSRKHGHGHRARSVASSVAPKRKAVSGSKDSVKEQGGSLRKVAPKPPRGGLHRRCSSGGMEADVLRSSSSGQAAASDREDEARKASSSRPLLGSGNGSDTTATENARAASPESDCGEVVDGGTPEADGGEAEAKNTVVDVAEKGVAEEIVVLYPEAKLGNGEITSDSETEPSYVFIKMKDETATRLSDALAGTDAEPHLEVKNGTGNADEATAAADADTASGTATKANAEEEGPARESSGELSSFSGTCASGRDSAPKSAPSCSSRSQSVERQLEEDAALLRKKRQDRGAGRGRSVQAASTPPSARNTDASGAARTTSPRGTGVGFKKRFLSFGKKNRGRDGATVIDCTSPASVPTSPADGGGSARRRCRTADPIRRRVVGSSPDTAASDDTEHGHSASPQACSLQSLVAASPAKSELSEMAPQERSPKSHRSFFSFRSFNCGRG